MKVKLTNVRLAFPNVFEAQTFNGEGTPTFSASFIFPPGHPAEAAMREAIAAVIKAKWGAKADAVAKELAAKDRTALHNGDSKSDFVGFAGQLFVSARNTARPLIIDADKTPLVAQDGRPYAGCFVNASIELWAQDNNYGKRVNATLRGLQFYKDGDAFSGGGAASDDDFDDVSSGADAGDLV